MTLGNMRELRVRAGGLYPMGYSRKRHRRRWFLRPAQPSVEGRWARAVRWYDPSRLTPWAFLEADCAARSCATCHARRGSCISSDTIPRADYPGCLLCTRNAGSCASHRQGTRHREGSVRTHKGIPSRPWRPPNREARAGSGDRMSHPPARRLLSVQIGGPLQVVGR
jgi:hypothetical protein